MYLNWIAGDQAWGSQQWHTLLKTQGFRWEIKSRIQTELNLNSRVPWMLCWSKRESVPCFELKQLSKANVELTITLRKKEHLSTLSIFILQSLAQHHYKQTIQTCHSLSNFSTYNLLHNHTWAKPFLEFARAAHGIIAPKCDFCLLLEWKRFWNTTNSFSTWKKIFRLNFFFMFILKVVFHSKLWGKKRGAGGWGGMVNSGSYEVYIKSFQGYKPVRRPSWQT